MNYSEAAQLAEKKVDNPHLYERFLIHVDGRCVGSLTFHRGFHSKRLVASVTYRSAEGKLETIFGADLPDNGIATFERRFPGCELRYTDERNKLVEQFGRDSREVRSFDDNESDRFQSLPS